ncbi:MAG: hypothetical protein WAW61_01985 [Methylococcaceae bacterium]
MKTLLFSIIIVSSLFILSGCEQSESLDAPQKFFSKNKSGKSPDYGIFKGLGDEDHVVTVHGFLDDLSFCLKLAMKLNEEEPGMYRCVPLNH